MSNLRILQRVSADINSTLDLDEICDVALRTMDELFEFHHANILLLEPDNNTLKVIASRGYENQAVGGRVPVDARQQPGTAARLCVGAAS
jgi:GAF domain-containing protein